MTDAEFEHAVEQILQRERRFDPLAYYFLKDSLDFTVKRLAGTEGRGRYRHVTGGELLAGFRDHALEQFGPMASTLMQEWGIRESGHVGEMVFHLIEERVFGKQDSDRKEDFAGAFDLTESLTTPFLPSARVNRPRSVRRPPHKARS
jgi:uncharacterized repeat protein (TIGR04138 family)